jgi:hypothetical protein
MIYSTISITFQARINATIINDVTTPRRIYELG